MAINTLATATLFMTQLDKIAVQEAITGWMDANAGQVIYNGGSEVKIPKMSVQGMGDYDREAGYQRGSVTLEYETRKMTQDRGRLFQLDPMDINEANFIPTAGAVMGEFQRTQVVPEIDAYRISKLATETLTADKAGMIGESYVPGTASTSALRKLKEGIKAVREVMLYQLPIRQIVQQTLLKVLQMLQSQVLLVPYQLPIPPIVQLTQQKQLRPMQRPQQTRLRALPIVRIIRSTI